MGCGPDDAKPGPGDAIDAKADRADFLADAGDGGIPSRDDATSDRFDSMQAEARDANVGDEADATTVGGDDGGSDHPDVDADSDSSDAAADGPAIPMHTCGVVGQNGSVLLDTGHAGAIVLIRQSGDRVLSQDASGHWVLWDVARRTPIVSGENPNCSGPICAPSVDLAGNTVAVRSSASTDLRSASDGQLLATVASSSAVFGLNSDGSYVWLASSAGLEAFSRLGEPLVDRGGNYALAAVAALPGELHIALGPAGNSVVELVPTTGGNAVMHSFSGTFHSWFLDGDRFLTTQGSVLRVYSKDGASQQLLALPNVLPNPDRITGQGAHFWTFNGISRQLNIYTVGTDLPVFSSTERETGTPIGSQHTIAVVDSLGSLDTLDLSSPVITRSHYDVPVALLGQFAADPSGRWSIGNQHGVLFESGGFGVPGGPLPLGCGEVWSIAGAASGRAAVATASGQILHFDLSRPSGADRLSGLVPFGSSKLELSSDGKRLAAAGNQNDSQYQLDRSLKIFELPSGTEIKTWAYSWQDYPTLFFDFAISPDCSRVAQLNCRFDQIWTCKRTVTDGTSSTTYYADDYPDPNHFAPQKGIRLALSPNNALIAVGDGSPPVADATTQIYDGTTLIGAVNGYLVGWIDATHFLVQIYVGASIFGSSIPTRLDSAIVDPEGSVVATPAFPGPIDRFSLIGTTAIYSARQNAVYSLSDGSTLWTSPLSQGGEGAVAGAYVVFAKGHQVFAEAR